MNVHPDLAPALPDWHTLLVLMPSLAAGAAALFASPRATPAQAWRGARCATGVALGAALLSLALVLSGFSGAGPGVRADATGAVLMLLVSFVGWVIVRYSQPYLNGEREERHGVRWMMATVAAVGLVIATNHVLVLALAWSATSWALHRLLTFYGDRPAAVVAAHKKSIVARMADLCMLAAVGLLFVAFDTWRLDQIVSMAASVLPVPMAAQVAAVLIACAALLKCAQLPFHGWLIQVMEAPTPVSALLHAGVVNLGGFVLLRFAPLVSEVPAAQVLLVVAGTTTAVLAALVMTTRISIKVMLAWSTCAQMGFMLMQCGLGLWEIALLHLVAHSLYKAHAFLGAGGVVRRTSLMHLTPAASAPSPLGLAVGALVALGMTVCASVAVGALAPLSTPAPSAAFWVMTCVVALALVPLVHAQSLKLGGLWLPALGLGALGVALAYFGLHWLLASWVLPGTPAPAVALPWLSWLVALAFGLLFLLQSAITVAPQGPWARRWYPWFYGGLFLDEKFNQLAFSLFPPPVPAAARAPLPASGTIPGARA